MRKISILNFAAGAVLGLVTAPLQLLVGDWAARAVAVAQPLHQHLSDQVHAGPAFFDEVRDHGNPQAFHVSSEKKAR